MRPPRSFFNSGLLSNGVFYVGRINGQLAVGTYGGGLSLLNETSGKWKSASHAGIC